MALRIGFKEKLSPTIKIASGEWKIPMGIFRSKPKQSQLTLHEFDSSLVEKEWNLIKNLSTQNPPDENSRLQILQSSKEIVQSIVTCLEGLDPEEYRKIPILEGNQVPFLMGIFHSLLHDFQDNFEHIEGREWGHISSFIAFIRILTVRTDCNLSSLGAARMSDTIAGFLGSFLSDRKYEQAVSGRMETINKINIVINDLLRILIHVCQAISLNPGIPLEASIIEAHKNIQSGQILRMLTSYFDIVRSQVTSGAPQFFETAFTLLRTIYYLFLVAPDLRKNAIETTLISHLQQLCKPIPMNPLRLQEFEIKVEVLHIYKLCLSHLSFDALSQFCSAVQKLIFWTHDSFALDFNNKEEWKDLLECLPELLNVELTRELKKIFSILYDICMEMSMNSTEVLRSYQINPITITTVISLFIESSKSLDNYLFLSRARYFHPELQIHVLRFFYQILVKFPSAITILDKADFWTIFFSDLFFFSGLDFLTPSRSPASSLLRHYSVVFLRSIRNIIFDNSALLHKIFSLIESLPRDQMQYLLRPTFSFVDDSLAMNKQATERSLIGLHICSQLQRLIEREMEHLANDYGIAVLNLSLLLKLMKLLIERISDARFFEINEDMRFLCDLVFIKEFHSTALACISLLQVHNLKKSDTLLLIPALINMLPYFSTSPLHSDIEILSNILETIYHGCGEQRNINFIQMNPRMLARFIDLIDEKTAGLEASPSSLELLVGINTDQQRFLTVFPLVCKVLAKIIKIHPTNVPVREIINLTRLQHIFINRAAEFKADPNFKDIFNRSLTSLVYIRPDADPSITVIENSVLVPLVTKISTAVLDCVPSAKDFISRLAIGMARIQKNQSICAPLVPQILNSLFRKVSAEYFRVSLELIQNIGSSYLTVSDIKKMILLIKEKKISSQTNRILKTLKNILVRIKILSFFEFDGENSGLFLPLSKTLSSKGFTISTHLSLTSLKMDQTPRIFHFSNEHGETLEFFFSDFSRMTKESRAQAQDSSRLILKGIALTVSYSYQKTNCSIVFPYTFKVGPYYMITVVFLPSTASKCKVRLYINAQQQDIKYLEKFQMPLSPKFTSLEIGFKTSHSVRKMDFFHGKIGNIYIFDEVLSKEQIIQMQENSFYVDPSMGFKNFIKYFLFLSPAATAVVYKTFKSPAVLNSSSRPSLPVILASSSLPSTSTVASGSLTNSTASMIPPTNFPINAVPIPTHDFMGTPPSPLMNSSPPSGLAVPVMSPGSVAPIPNEIYPKTVFPDIADDERKAFAMPITLEPQYFITKNMRDTFHSINGVDLLLPIIQQLHHFDPSKDDFAVFNSNLLTVLDFLKIYIVKDDIRQLSMLQSKTFQILGYLLSKLNPILLEANVLTELDTLAPLITNHELRLEFLYYLMFEWQIWANCSNSTIIEWLSAAFLSISMERDLFYPNFLIYRLLDFLFYQSEGEMKVNDDQLIDSPEVFSKFFSFFSRFCLENKISPELMVKTIIAYIPEPKKDTNPLSSTNSTYHSSVHLIAPHTMDSSKGTELVVMKVLKMLYLMCVNIEAIALYVFSQGGIDYFFQLSVCFTNPILISLSLKIVGVLIERCDPKIKFDRYYLMCSKIHLASSDFLEILCNLFFGKKPFERPEVLHFLIEYLTKCEESSIKHQVMERIQNVLVEFPETRGQLVHQPNWQRCLIELHVRSDDNHLKSLALGIIHLLLLYCFCHEKDCYSLIRQNIMIYNESKMAMHLERARIANLMTFLLVSNEVLSKVTKDPIMKVNLIQSSDMFDYYALCYLKEMGTQVFDISDRELPQDFSRCLNDYLTICCSTHILEHYLISEVESKANKTRILNRFLRLLVLNILDKCRLQMNYDIFFKQIKDVLTSSEIKKLSIIEPETKPHIITYLMLNCLNPNFSQRESLFTHTRNLAQEFSEELDEDLRANIDFQVSRDARYFFEKKNSNNFMMKSPSLDWKKQIQSWDEMDSDRRKLEDIDKSQLNYLRFVNLIVHRKTKFQIEMRELRYRWYKNWQTLNDNLENERMIWGSDDPVYWKLDKVENQYRMRLRMKRNYKFDPHIGKTRIPEISSTTPTTPTRSTETESSEEPQLVAESVLEPDSETSSTGAATESALPPLPPPPESPPPPPPESTSDGEEGEDNDNDNKEEEEEEEEILAAAAAAAAAATITKSGGGEDSVVRVNQLLRTTPVVAEVDVEEEEFFISNFSVPSDQELIGTTILETPANLITPLNVTKGTIIITYEMIKFTETEAPDSKLLKEMSISMSEIREIRVRRYLLRRSAIEIFLNNRKAVFFNFVDRKFDKKVQKIGHKLGTIARLPAASFVSDLPHQIIRKSELTRRWQMREISNFEYLMQLNSIAGRSYNDITQYPVFPWILTDYESEDICIGNPDVYRDLSLPVGALDPDRLKSFVERYNNFFDDAIPKFFYGTHYSSAAIVLFFLIRMEPYTSYFLQLQGGKFDHPDRMFHSISQTWSNCLKAPTDVKELIPEFFYLSSFLNNSNNFNFGCKQNGDPMHNVTLPPWAKSPTDFIYIHRLALESEQVSRKLNDWIDLIFGYKQRGKFAEDACNVFYHLTYEGAVDIDAIQDVNQKKSIEAQLDNFGQTPAQLFIKTPHPPRFRIEDSRQTILQKIEYTRLGLHLKCKEQLPLRSGKILTMLSSSFFLSEPKFDVLTERLVLIYTDRTAIICKYVPAEEELIFEPDTSISNSKIRIPGYISMRLKPHSFLLLSDSKHIAVSSYWDYTFQLISLESGKVVQSIYQHNDVVTCLALTNDGEYLASGSADTSIVIWRMQKKPTLKIIEKPVAKLPGHEDEVTAISLDANLDLCVSGSKDGTVIFHNLRSGTLVHCVVHQAISVSSIAISSFGFVVVLFRPRNEPLAKSGELIVFDLNGQEQTSLSKELPFKVEVGMVFVPRTIPDLLIFTQKNKLNLCRPNKLSFFHSIEIQTPSEIVSIVESSDKSHLIVSFSNGLVSFLSIPEKITTALLNENEKLLTFGRFS